MALCLRGKTKCDCIRRCDSGLLSWPELAAGCRAACLTGDPPANACDYLENYLAGGDQTQIAYYGIDCDPFSGSGIMGLPETQALILADSPLLQTLNGSGDGDNTLSYLFIGGLVLIAVGLLAYAFLKK